MSRKGSLFSFFSKSKEKTEPRRPSLPPWNATNKDFRCEELLHASRRGDLDSLKTLVEAPNSQLDISDEFGCTPLFNACLGGHFGAAKLLLEQGCRVNSSNRLGLTPLHGAVQSGDEKLCTLLVQYGADLLAKSLTSQSPADYAYSLDLPDLANTLRLHAAEYFLKNIKLKDEPDRDFGLASFSLPTEVGMNDLLVELEVDDSSELRDSVCLPNRLSISGLSESVADVVVEVLESVLYEVDLRLPGPESPKSSRISMRASRGFRYNRLPVAGVKLPSPGSPITTSAPIVPTLVPNGQTNAHRTTSAPQIDNTRPACSSREDRGRSATSSFSDNGSERKCADAMAQLSTLFMSRDHRFGRHVHKFVESMNTDYMARLESLSTMRPSELLKIKEQVTTRVTQFLDGTMEAIVAEFSGMDSDCGREVVNEALELAVFAGIHGVLYPIFIQFSEKDDKDLYESRWAKLRKPEHFDLLVPERFRQDKQSIDEIQELTRMPSSPSRLGQRRGSATQVAMHEEFQRAMAMLRGLEHTIGPTAKLTHLVKASRAIIRAATAVARGGDVCADDLVPLLSLALVLTRPPNIRAQIDFMGSLAVSQPMGEKAYCLTTLQVATDFLLHAHADDPGDDPTATPPDAQASAEALSLPDDVSLAAARRGSVSMYYRPGI
eukprot:Rmarinus@m.11909